MANTSTGIIKNPNKKVTLISSKNSSDTNFDWRHNISRILTNISSDSKVSSYMINSNVFSDYDVSSCIELILDKYPEVKTANGSTSAIKSALSTVDKYTGGYATKIYDSAKTLGGGLHDLFKAVGEDSYNVDGSSNVSASFNPWIENVPAWTGGQGFSAIVCTFNFNMGQYGLWDARQEVVNPIMNLMAPTLPRLLTDFTLTPPFPNVMQMLKQVFLGLFDAFKNAKENGNIFSSLTTEMTEFYNSFTYTVQIGNLYTFSNMLIKNCKVNFSTETDESGNPISGTIELEMNNIVPPALSYSQGISSFNMKGGK